ncbi:MAG: hypothetical protein RBT11_07100 [Desulfobacterales bacterium]|jgi:hypothetical protein|nr:hypothetical protein [Desulfobacterales bacterium]
MLSLNYDIGEFIRALGSRDRHEAIWLAHQEALSVERLLLKPMLTINLKKQQMEKYSMDLKNLIASIRYLSVPKKVYGAGWFELLNRQFQRGELPSDHWRRESYTQKKRPYPILTDF